MVPFKIAALRLWSKSLKNCYKGNHFLIKLLAFYFQFYQKNILFYRYFSKIVGRGAEELNFRNVYETVFCSTPDLQSYSRTASKAKYETAIHISVKYFLAMKKCKLNMIFPLKSFKFCRIH